MSLGARTFSNRYEIQREIARGGMAEVYLARDQLLDRPVALKVLFQEFARDPSFVERFRREAQAAANLNHPNIVAIYDWGQEDGTYFIVMEYVEGRSLRDLIRSDGPLDPSTAADVAAEIGSALSYAHRGGVVHRDVKPGNVLITPSGQVKVTDFGIARAGTSEALTQTGAVMGTATYFSPEQAQGLPVDGRSDVYSLGVVLYEMLTGVPPFTGDNPVAVAYKHVREQPVPPSQRMPGTPPDLERIVLTAMAKDLEARYQSAEDLRADLLRFRRGRPLVATPLTAEIAMATTGISTAAGPPTLATTPVAPRPASTGPPPPRRSPWAVAAVVIVLLLLAGLVGFLIVDQLGDDSGPATADVPGVVGLTIDEARSTLEEAGFEVDEERVANEDVPEDEVFDQEPPEGTKLRKGQPVTLKVSAGQGTVEVPNVVGDSADDARAAIEAAGLVFVPQFEESERPVGTVIRTDPPVGEELERGTEVTVFLAVAEQVEVPEVEGLDAVTAANQLGARGFVTRQVTEPSDDFATGQVIRTEPPAGELVPKGETIVMFVSSGPETARVPNVVNLSESAAREALAGDGFTNVVVVGVTVANPASAGKVVAQDPVAGTTWPLGDTVTLQIGQTPPTTTTSAPPPTTTTVAP